jgi:hypothetical protein
MLDKLDTLQKTEGSMAKGIAVLSTDWSTALEKTGKPRPETTQPTRLISVPLNGFIPESEFRKALV